MAEPKKSKKKKDHLEEYRKVVDASQLENVTLVNLEFNVQPAFFSDRERALLSYEIDVSDNDYNTESNLAAAYIDAVMAAHLDEEPVVLCQARYIVRYSLTELCDEEAVSTFLRRVAVFACYPYFRTIVANLDWAAGMHLPPLPVHRESPAKKADQDKPSTKDEDI